MSSSRVLSYEEEAEREEEDTRRILSSESLAPNTASKRPSSSVSVDHVGKKKRLLEMARNSLVDEEDSQNDAIIRRQVDLYLSIAAEANRCEVDFDVLGFWKKYAQQIPWVAALARKCLAIPATSAAAERIFSTTGLIVCAKRSSIKPHRVNQIQFVHDHFKTCKVMKK